MFTYINKIGRGLIFWEVRSNGAGRSTLHKADLFYIHFPGKVQMHAVFKLPGKQYGQYMSDDKTHSLAYFDINVVHII